MFHCLVIKVLCVSLSFDSSFSLSRSFSFVKNFFKFFQNFLMNFCDFVTHQQLVYSIAFISECQELFLFFSVFISHLLHKTQKKSASSRSGFKYIIVVFIRQAFFIKFLKKFELTGHIDKEYSIRYLFRSIRGLFFLFRCCITQSVPEMRSI